MTVDISQTTAAISKNRRLVVIAATLRERNETAHKIPSMCRFILRTSARAGLAWRPCLSLERLYNKKLCS